MKRIRVKGPAHIELPGCIVNITPRLSDHMGREVTSVQITADGDRYSGEPEWWINGYRGQGSLNVRVVRLNGRRRATKRKST